MVPVASISNGKRKEFGTLDGCETAMELLVCADNHCPARKLAKLSADQAFCGTDLFLSAECGAVAPPRIVSVKRKAVEAVSTATVRQKVDGAQPVRRLQVVVAPVSYAKYGVAKGAISDGTMVIDCLIISKGWPGWAFGALGAGFTIRALVMLDDAWVSSVRQFLPTVNVVTYVSSAEQLRLFLDPVDVIFSDVDPPGCLRTWELARLAVVTLHRCRRPPRGWSTVSAEVHHEAVGGVTTQHHPYYLHLRDTAFPSPLRQGLVICPAAFRDLASIMVNHTQSGVECVPPVPMSQLAPSVRCLNGETCFHSGGWLPGFNRRFTVVTPCVFTKTKWCRRRLTADEWLGVFDMPSIAMKRLSVEQKTSFLSTPFLVPLKIHYSIAQALRTWLEFPLPLGGNITHNLGVDVSLAKPGLNSVGATTSSGVSLALPAAISAAGSATTSDNTSTQVEDNAARIATATKSDDAAIPYHLWNDRLLQGLSLPSSALTLGALERLRLFFHQLWRRNLTHSFLVWSGVLSGKKRLGFVHPAVLVSCCTQSGVSHFRWTVKGRKQYRAMRKLESSSEKVNRLAAADCLRRGANSTWWEWSAGSRPFFWRWPTWYLAIIRDGLPLWLKGPAPRWCQPQRIERDPVTLQRMRTKISTPLERGYLERGEVYSLTSVFSVPKGEEDIRLVYDGTKSGLNNVLWAPWFPLPTIEQHNRVATVGCYMADIDIGEMFLNFVMHEAIRVYCGVDLTNIFPEMLLTLGLAVFWVRWSRCGMGFTTSPYQAVQGMTVAEEVILGDPADSQNIFRFDEVVLNLPGMPSYNPALAWVSKVRRDDGRVACDLFIYVDDARVIAGLEEDCWKATRRTASVVNWLGLQDAPRKRRAGCTEPGPWSGSICHSSGDQIEVLISQERWNKTKAILSWLKSQLEENQGRIEFKALRSKRGYLVYISRTYPSMCPYLKGIHQTLESWRPYKREDGWNMSAKEIREVQMIEGDEEEDSAQEFTEAPAEVMAVRRLRSDVDALMALTEGLVPTKRKVRPSFSAVATYCFGDASGKGFGSSLSINGRLVFRHGQWSKEMEAETSNYRELANLVLTVEESSSEGLLDDCELFLFTDNTTAESAFYKGTSSVKPLFDLMLRLRKLQMNGGLMIHMIHIAGTRMIAEGTDDLSRGSILQGVMAGNSMLSHIPLHLDALQRQPNIADWLASWLGSLGDVEDDSFRFLSPMDWFIMGQYRDRCIWMPPPAVADVAVELLGKSKLKRPQHEHVFVCPRLMTNRWRKQLSKICDVLFTMPVGTNIWGVDQHEPLLVGFSFPLIQHRPWRLRGTKLMERVVGQLSDLPQTDFMWGRDILRELLVTTRGLDGLPYSMVRKML